MKSTVAAISLALAATPAAAATDDPDIRSACRNEIGLFCGGRAGQALTACLERYERSLHPDCRDKVSGKKSRRRPSRGEQPARKPVSVAAPDLSAPSDAPGGIETVGSPEFSARARESLSLLERTPLWDSVHRNIAILKQGEHSGMAAYLAKPTMEVGDPTWKESPIWFAGAIAHDACHSRLYHEAAAKTGGRPPEEAWMGKLAELECIQVQLNALNALGADAYTLAYMENLKINPTYHETAYEKRNW